jgi:hypothetical protein
LHSSKTNSLISTIYPIKAIPGSFTKKHIVSDALVVALVEPSEVRGLLHMKEMSRYLEQFVAKVCSFDSVDLLLAFWWQYYYAQ